MSRDDDVYFLATPEVIEGEVVGDELPSPWDLTHRVEALDAVVAAMNRQIEASVQQLGGEYVHGWISLWVRWRRLVEALQRGPPAGEGVREQVAEYEQRVAQWRREAEVRGVRLSMPPPTPPRRCSHRPRSLPSAGSVVSGEGDGEPEDDWAEPVAIATAVGLTAIAVVAVVNKLSS